MRAGGGGWLRVAAVCLAAMGLPAAAGAQTALGIRYYGEVRSPAPPRTLAIGGIAAVRPWGPEPTAVGYRNPALAGYARRVMYGFTWEVGRLAGDYPDGRGSLLQIGPRMVGIMAPFGRGFAAEVTLSGLTTSEFEIHSQEASINGIAVRYDYFGSGGLDMGTVALAWAHPGGRVAVGVSANILFGSVKKEWKVEFIPPGYVDTSDRLQRQHSGRRWTFGFELSPLERLRVGGAVSTSANLDVTQIYTSSNATTDTSRAEMELGGGLVVSGGFRLTDLWAVYADYRRDAWNSTAWIRAPAGATGAGSGISDFAGFSPDWDFGVGVERQARAIEEQVTAFDTLPIRAGFRWGEIYAPDLDGGRVTQLYATLGTSFALGRGKRAWGDLAVQIGRRSGSTGVSETFWRIQLGMTGAELWFQPPQR